MLLIPPLVITANATTVGAAFPGLRNMTYLAVLSKLVVVGGGGTVDVYIQTSLDGGASWIDIMNHHFTTSTLSKVSAVNSTVALAGGVTPGSLALASNTILNGLLGTMLKATVVSAGTVYTGATTLSVFGTPIICNT